MIGERVVQALLSACAPGGGRGRLSILQFHRLPGPGTALPPGEMSQANFERILDAIASHMRILPLQDAVTALARGRLPARTVALTFDDGYAEWLDFVAPALLKRQLHATFFVTTGQLPGGGMWHERLNAAVQALPATGMRLPLHLCGFERLETQALRDELSGVLQEELKYLPVPERDAAVAALEAQAVRPLAATRTFSADSVRHLHTLGFDIGAHTVTHPILNQASDREAEQEIGRSREELQAIIGAPVQLFAYPNGRPVRDYSARHVEMVRRCGYRAAVATGGGVAHSHDDVYQLPRFTPWGPSRAHSLFQIARNALRPTPPRRVPGRRTRVMVVENGAGFGGAIIALQTLLHSVPAERYEVHVVSNLAVGSFGNIEAVRSHRVINDERLDFKPWVARLMRHGSSPWRRAVAFGLGRADDLLNRLPYLLTLYRHARRLQPDIVHGNNEPYSNREAMIVAKLLQRPFVQHLRGTYPRMTHTRALLQRPDQYIAVSQWLARRLVEDGVAPGKVRQIYDAVDVHPEGVGPAEPARAALLQSLGLASRSRLIAMVGMLLPWKGQSLFIEASLAVAARHDEVAFLIVGATPERGEAAYGAGLLQQVRNAKAESRIHFLGHRADVQALMPAFDAVVSASLNPEPLGLVMLEAMDAGCIFIGPAHGAALELVRDGENGFLFTPGSAASLAAAMQRALDTPVDALEGRATSIGRAGALAVRQQFAPATCQQLTLSVYEALR